MEKKEKLVFEACVGNYSEAKRSQELGANRIELCENLKEGGTTPSYGTISLCKQNLSIPIAVMIRPRAGNFIYSAPEIEIMKEDIKICKAFDVESIVLGVLTPENKIDIPLLKEFIELARPLKVVFHMAFDEIEEKFEALSQLIDLGVYRVLTKGCKTNAIEGIEVLKSLDEKANKKIIIVAGGGVTKDNFMKIASVSEIFQFHGTRIVGDLK